MMSPRHAKDAANNWETPRPRGECARTAAPQEAGDDADEATRERLRAHAAAADNVGLFFGEDVFIAIGSILLIKGVLAANGVRVEPAHVALWAVPTALAAFAVHGARLLLLDRRLARERNLRQHAGGAA